MTTETPIALRTRITQATIGEDLAEWFLKQGDKVTIPHKEAAVQIKAIYKHLTGNSVDITRARLSNLVSSARIYLETNNKKTIVAVLKQGYKLANAKEATIFAAMSFKRLLRTAETVERRIKLIDRKHLPESIFMAFNDSRQSLELLNKRGGKYLLEYQNIPKTNA